MASTPKTLLSTCSNCGRHVFVDESVCPFCRAARIFRTAGMSVAMLASACGGNTSRTAVDAGAAVVDARADAPHDAGGAPESSTPDSGVADTGALDAGAADTGADVYDPCAGPGCPCCIYRSPPPRTVG